MSEQSNKAEQFIQVPESFKKHQEAGRAALSAVANIVEVPSFVPKAEAHEPNRNVVELDPATVNPDNVFGFDKTNPDHVADLLRPKAQDAVESQDEDA